MARSWRDIRDEAVASGRVDPSRADTARRQMADAELNHRAAGTVIAEVTRADDGWWAVEVPSIDGLHTQVRELDHVPATVVDAARLLGVDISESDVQVRTDRGVDFADHDRAMEIAERQMSRWSGLMGRLAES